MRILANHGGDKRFAFLRGRWSRTWRLEKKKVVAENAAKAQTQSAERTGAGLGVLADYGDSDEEDDKESDKNAESSIQGDNALTENSQDTETEAAIKEARRARAREWAEKRRASTSSKS
jgi:hypothetical protein